MYIVSNVDATIAARAPTYTQSIEEEVRGALRVIRSTPCSQTVLQR